MLPTENLYYAIGELAYSVARADGRVQAEERTRLHDIIVSELGSNQSGINISEIIFTLIDRHSNTSSETSYHWAMNEIRANGHYLSPDLKTRFLNVMKRIAEAYPPVTDEEKKIIERFKKDIEGIAGDPVFYNATS